MLVHGWRDSEKQLAPLARHLRSRGRAVVTPRLSPSDGAVGLDRLAEQLRQAVDRELGAGARFDLVGFSMGGLVSRYFLQRLGGLGRVRRFVTVASPHRGSVLAKFVSNAGCRQMRPGSPFLADLDRDLDALAAAGFTSLYTPLDLMVFPGHSGITPVSKNIPVWMPAHPLMIAHPHCIRLIGDLLERGAED